MFEEDNDVQNKINPESLNPQDVKRNRDSAIKDDKADSKDYEDTPEFRKSLNMKVRKR